MVNKLRRLSVYLLRNQRGMELSLKIHIREILVMWMIEERKMMLANYQLWMSLVKRNKLEITRNS